MLRHMLQICKTAVTAVKTLFDEYFTRYGWPTKLITDQGPAFESQLFSGVNENGRY